MAYETKPHRGLLRSVRRAWLCSVLLSLPSLILIGIYLYQSKLAAVPILLLAASLLLYLGLVASSLVGGFVRPLHTLSNVVSSLREGDFSLRAGGAGAGDALGELADEINSLADLLQEQRVRSSEATALLERILDVMHTPLYAFDRESRLRLINSAGAKLLDLISARCLGLSADELGLAEMLAAPDESIQMFGAKPTRWLLRKAIFRQNGEPQTLLVLADVSIPLREEEQAAWGRLVRVLGHEISNSLTPIKSIAASLLVRLDDLNVDEAATTDFRRGLGVIEGRADALNRFVQSYRMLAQLPRPRLRPVSLEPLVERVSFLEQRLTVNLEPGPNLVLRADPDQLEQMLINLLTNAADASLANANLLVRINWSLAGSGVQIVIEDRGLGIANPDNLFVPFYTTKPAGSGIGLALAQQIARAHGGDVSLINRQDAEGARAIVWLPLTSSQKDIQLPSD